MSPVLKLMAAALYHTFERVYVWYCWVFLLMEEIFSDFYLLMVSLTFFINISPFSDFVVVNFANNFNPDMSKYSNSFKKDNGISCLLQLFHLPYSSILHLREVTSLWSWHTVIAVSK